MYLYFFEKKNCIYRNIFEKYSKNLHMFKKITNVGRRLVM